MSNTSPSRSLRPAQAATFIGVGLSTFWRYTKTREDFPKAVKLARNVAVFQEDELAAWVKKQVQQRAA